MIWVLENKAMGPIHHGTARVRGQQSTQGPEQCGLATAIGSQQDVEGSLWHFNRCPFQHLNNSSKQLMYALQACGCGKQSVQSIEGMHHQAHRLQGPSESVWWIQLDEELAQAWLALIVVACKSLSWGPAARDSIRQG